MGRDNTGDYRQIGFVQRTNEEGENEIVYREEYYSYDDFAVPNWLINAKYKSSLLHQRCLDLIISNVPNGNYDREGSLIVQVDTSTIKRYLQVKGNGWYTSLDRVARTMAGQVLGYRNPETKEFRYFPFISKAELKEGRFTVRFVPEVAPILTKLYAYTNMNLTVNRKFESVYAKILYQQLKSECYYPKNTPKEIRTNKFYIEKSLAELRIQTACVNPELSAVRKVLNETGKNGQPDYERAVKAAKGEQMYKDYHSFKVNVLDVAVNQINELADYTKMNVRYEAIRAGRGARVVSIGFYVVLLKEKNISDINDVSQNTEETDKNEIYDQIAELIEEKMKVSDIIAIAETADYQMPKIEKAYAVAKQQKTIENLTGWMISAIKNNYEPVAIKKKENKNEFKKFKQRDYDYDKLVEELTSNNYI